MKRYLQIALVAVLGVGGAAHAAPITITFDEPNDIGFVQEEKNIRGTTLAYASGTIDGLLFESVAYPLAGCGFSGVAQAGVDTGSTSSSALVARAVGNSCTFIWGVLRITVTHAAGLPFALHDADWYSLKSYDFPLGNPIEGTALFTGVTMGGDTVTTATPFGTGDWMNLESFSLALTFDCEPACSDFAVELNSLTVSVVPIPAAVWLFVSGLAVLGWCRRRVRLAN